MLHTMPDARQRYRARQMKKFTILGHAFWPSSVEAFSLTFVDPEIGRSGELVRFERVYPGHDGDAGDLALRPVRLLRRELEGAACRVAGAPDGIAATLLIGLIDLMRCTRLVFNNLDSKLRKCFS